jgi:hypothetical protein
MVIKMHFPSLVETIAKKLNFHNSRVQTFCEMAQGMLKQQNVQHHALVEFFSSPASLKSKLERARRFFSRARNPSHSLCTSFSVKHLGGYSQNASYA